MSEKIDFLKKLKPRLANIEKDSLYQRIHDAVQETLLWEYVVRSIDEGILLLDVNGLLIRANPRAETWLNLPSGPNKRSPVWDQLSDSQLTTFLKEQIGTGLTNRVVHDIKILSPREMLLRITLIPYSAEWKKAIIVILTDMTERSEQEFENTMIHRIESLIRLAGGIAHEIGNPLNAITIHLELLKKELKGIPESKRVGLERSLNDIQEEIKRLDRIIRNFLRATRRPPLRFQLENLNEIVEAALSFLKPELTTANIKVRLTTDDTVPLFLMDRERLYYAFMNLIKNAMEAMPHGGNLKINLTHKDNCALAMIQDTGCGIAKENISKIFDIYYTTKKEGAGLGLMMVYDAIAEHGGRINVTSTPKKGTTFRISLPIREPQRQLPNYAQPKGGAD